MSRLCTSGTISQPTTDADADAYIALVEAEVGSLTEAQTTAIQDFFSAGWTRDYNVQGLFLFNWANANANAINLVDRTSGTWNGTVNHTIQAGYSRADNTTGYFDTGFAPSDYGSYESSDTIMVAMQRAHAGATEALIGSYSAYSNSHIFRFLDGTQRVQYSGGGTGAANSIFNANANRAGVWAGSAVAGALSIDKLTTAGGWSNIANGSPTILDTTPTANYRVWDLGNGSNRSGADLGFAAIGGAVSLANTKLFAEAVKDLWETLTGLTAP